MNSDNQFLTGFALILATVALLHVLSGCATKQDVSIPLVPLVQGSGGPVPLEDAQIRDGILTLSIEHPRSCSEVKEQAW